MKKKYDLCEKRSTCIKCVLVGDSGVGKSNVAARMSSRNFKEEYQPTLFDNYAGKLSYLVLLCCICPNIRTHSLPYLSKHLNKSISIPMQVQNSINPNSVDPDQTPQYAVSDQGLHCSLRPVLPNT